MTTAAETTLDAKLAALDARIAGFDRVAVAFSGGVDSTALLHACVRVLGRDRVLAVTADSASLPRAEREEAVQLARQMGARLEILNTQELENPSYRANDGERCYFCKKELFAAMELLAARERVSVLAYGAIADDLLDHRPGARAAREFRVVAPLQETGFSKEEIREYSRRHGLPTASKASFACLASRIPRGTQVTAEALEKIERAEQLLREAGFRQFRVRLWGDSAKIELAPEETHRLLLAGAEEISVGIRDLGFSGVFLDLRGYRSPSSQDFVQIETPFWQSVRRDLEVGTTNLDTGQILRRLCEGNFPGGSLLWPLSR